MWFEYVFIKKFIKFVEAAKECIKLELITDDNVYNFILLYRAQSQAHDDFDTFIQKN